MSRYYEIRVNREAWATSVAIHLWLLALLIWLPIAVKPKEPPSQPLELTMIDLGGPAGDRANGTDRPAPKPLVHAHARPEYHPDAVAEPRPIAHHVAPVPRSRPQARPKVDTVSQPNPLALAAEEKRRKKLEEQQLAQAAQDTGAPDGSAGGQGTATRPVSGGAVSVGHGASGDLAGRAIESLVRADFPSSAESRHEVGWRGTVVARLRVAPDGHVADVSIVRSSGDDSVDSAAVSAFRDWRFSALPSGQNPVDQVGTVKMRFVLK